MYSLTKSLAVLALFSGAVLASPHSVRDAHRHHALVARHAAPEPAPVAVAEAFQERSPVAHASTKRMMRKARRSNTQRCKTRSSTASLASSTAAASSSASSVDAAPTIANVGADPSIASSSTEAAPTTSDTPAPAPTTSSTEAPAPTTSSTEAPAPTTAPPAPTTSSTEAPAPTTAASSGSGSGLNFGQSYLDGQQTGQGTFYETGLGACGITNTDSDFIAAASHLLFDTFPGYDGVNPNNNPLCNLKVTANYQGKTVTVAITDRCTGCAITDLDFSPAAFDVLADPSVGRLSGMTWTWNDLESIAKFAV